VLRLNRTRREVSSSTRTRSTRTRVVDPDSVVRDARGRLDARYTTHGLHLDEAGYEPWVDHPRPEGYR